jgi:hypothetical protein
MGALLLALVWTAAGCGGGGGGGPQPPAATGRVVGTVKYNDGVTTVPLANGTVSAGGITATTGIDGKFTLENVPITAVQGTVTAGGYNNKTFVITLARASDVYNAGTVTVTKAAGGTATITGKVVIAGTGASASGAKVMVGPDNTHLLYSSFTNSSGVFTIAGVPIPVTRIKVVGSKVEGGYHDGYFKIDYAVVAGVNNVGTLSVTSYSQPPPPPPFDW